MTILVVDDEPTIRELLTDALQGSGDTVVAVSNLREAEELLQTAQFDAMVLDDLLPGGPGSHWLPTLADTRPELPKRTILIFGGDLSIDEVRKIASVGAHWLRKPFELQVLVDAVHGVGER